MLARPSALRAATKAVSSPLVAPAGSRNMATLREIELRLKSVKNIEKITKVGRVLVGRSLNADEFSSR